METSVHDLDPKAYFKLQKEIQVFHHPLQNQAASQVAEKLKILKIENHLALFSSGTTSSTLKGYVLSLAAMEANAQAVNDFYQITSQDIWGLSIPDYHVGGLSVLMRAKLNNSLVVDCRGWNPEQWSEKISNRKVTVTTVVPTQVFDLVMRQLKSPPHLRLLIVGGDFLSFELEKRAKALGWPIVRTYGMSEVCSQLASARLNSTQLEILPIHQVKNDRDERLLIKSPALFTLQFQMGDEWIVKTSQQLSDEQGFYITQDRVKINNRTITPLGRIDEQLKVAGHLIDLPALKETLYARLLDLNLYGQAELTIENDERKGKKLVLLHLPSLSITQLNQIQSALLPQGIDELRAVPAFERTDLGKLKSTK